MSAQLFQWVGDCFMLMGMCKEMHCLGAVSSGSASTQRAGSCGSVLGVVRALGVLVSEGRVQGPPRGYKEGPHCAAPLQPPPNNHVCEKDNYLCDRYVILVREIADRVTACSYLCVEVLLCTDCPCGLAKATCKDPVLPIPPSISIAPWQQSSEMLLEYWHISVVPSKGPEMMNNQSLYQAVRSRLHFSQVAAWWSRSKGSAPSYITTRVVSFSEENLRKFRETPSEHTFPLAACGDGNSIKVTVWALPRVEDVPVLSCPIHPVSDNEDEGAARALTPTKIAPIQGTSSNPETLLLPTLVDDRLQTPCNESGKHHCRCEEEDTGCPPSPSVQRGNGERKRRRSLPRGPDFAPSVVPHGTALPPGVLTSVSELVVEERQRGGGGGGGENRIQINGALSVPNISESQNGENVVNQPRNLGLVNYVGESLFNQLKLDNERDKKNVEKRYKISKSGGGSSGDGCEFTRSDNCWDDYENKCRNDKSGKFNKKECLRRWERAGEFNNGLNNPVQGIGKINWITSTINERRETRSEKISPPFVDQVPIFGNNFKPSNGRPNVVANPFAESSPFHESNPGPSTNVASNGGEKSLAQGEDLSKLMTRMRLPEKGLEEGGEDEEGGILDWISKVPGRVFGAKNSCEPVNVNDNREARTKLNSSLELSQREFDEVLAVLRARTPGGRRRPTMQRILKRRERLDKQNVEENSERRDNMSEKKSETKYRKGRQEERAEKDIEGVYNVTNKADILLGAILRSSGKERKEISEISNGARPRGPTPSSKGEKETGRIVAQVKTFENETAQFLQTSPTSTGLNKRISRFKQLFAKDQNNGEGGNLQGCIIDESRAKRRIDFSGFLSDAQPNEEASSSSSSTSSSFNATGNISPSEIRRPFSNGKRSTTNLRLRIDGRTTNGFVHRQEEVDPLGQRKNSTVIDNLENSDASDKAVPSAIEQERFRRSLGNAASMVFHSRTGLPLTSSPAPLRRGSCCFDYDSSLNSVSSKRSALFELNTPPSPGAVSLEEGDREAEITCEEEETTKRRNPSRGLPHSHALLGSFEESALNGRLEPVSTVHGFTAELGASGSFCPKHRKLPVTVFFYTLGDNDKVSTPYLAHINLGKKGYQVPRSGTIQVTLLNPLGTVVKMFVVMYDLSDMPARSHTFLRQRTLRDKTLRYLIHLRFMSGKSGRIYLHTDIRMIICRKSDVDTASDLGAEPPKELRSFVHGPTNPKFSPRC